MKSEKKSKIVFTLLACICIAMFCFAITPKTLQNDTYYTVKIGEYIFQNGISNLTEDLYSWHDLPYTYPHWLYDLGTYIVFKAFSWNGIYVLTIILSIILGLSIFYISSKLSKNQVVAFFVSFGAMYILKPFVAARAQLLTFVLFAWTVYFIERFLETHKIRYGVGLVLIPLIIANVHCAVFPFYFVLYLPYIGEYIIAVLVDLDLDKRFAIGALTVCDICVEKLSWKKKIKEKIEKQKSDIKIRKEKRLKNREHPYKIKIQKNHFVIVLIGVAVLAFTTGLINPAGTGAYTYFLKTMEGNTTSSINEHLPLTLIDNTEFTVAIVVFLAILIFTDTKIKLSDLFMLAGLTYLSFKMRRQVSMFAIFCGFILVKMISAFLDKYDKNLCKKIIKVESTAIGALLLIGIVVYISYDLYKPVIKDEYIDKGTYPVEAAEWIKDNLDLSTLKLYNEYNYGSYLLYEDIPVFIDSRCDLYTPEFGSGEDIFSDALSVPGLNSDYENIFEKYDVRYVMLESDSNVNNNLKDDVNYDLLYDDGSFAIYKRLNAE